MTGSLETVRNPRNFWWRVEMEKQRKVLWDAGMDRALADDVPTGLTGGVTKGLGGMLEPCSAFFGQLRGPICRCSSLSALCVPCVEGLALGLSNLAQSFPLNSNAACPNGTAVRLMGPCRGLRSLSNI